MLLGSILLTAVSMRAAISAVGPLLPAISRTYGLTDAEAGVLTALPVIAFACVSPFAPGLARRTGSVERALLLAMIALTAGTAVRSLAPAAGVFYAGTFALAAGIALANVLLPALVKQARPNSLGFLTGLYVTVMNLVAALASGLALPLAHLVPGGWRASLAVWSPLAALAVAAWALQIRSRQPAPVTTLRAPWPWRSRVAWQVTAFMGLQSFGAYIILGWLPSFVEHHGTSATPAGWQLFTYQAAAVISGATAGLVVTRVRDHRTFACLAAALAVIGYVGLLVDPGFAFLWIVVVGLSAGAGLVLGLTLIGLKAQTPGQAAALSAMAQSYGYGGAAIGPFLFGALHALSGSWTPPMLLLISSAGMLAIVGLYVGSPRAIVEHDDSHGYRPPVNL